MFETNRDSASSECTTTISRRIDACSAFGSPWLPLSCWEKDLRILRAACSCSESLRISLEWIRCMTSRNTNPKCIEIKSNVVSCKAPGLVLVDFRRWSRYEWASYSYQYNWWRRWGHTRCSWTPVCTSIVFMNALTTSNWCVEAGYLTSVLSATSALRSKSLRVVRE